MKINKTEILAWVSIHLKKVLGMEESGRFGRKGGMFCVPSWNTHFYNGNNTLKNDGRIKMSDITLKKEIL